MKNFTNFILLLIVLHTTHCPITNKLFLKPSRIKGTEAKEILNNRLASLIVNDISTSNNAALANDFIIPILAGIQDDNIYSRQKVESCATKIFLGAVAIDQPNITANRNKKAKDPIRPSDPASRLYPPLLCNLKPINKIIDLD